MRHLSGTTSQPSREMRMHRMSLEGATNTEKVWQKMRKWLLSGTQKRRIKEMLMVRIILDVATGEERGLRKTIRRR